VELVQNDVYTTDTLDTKALDILQSGGKVLILAAGKVSGNSRNKGCLGFTRMPVVCGGRILNQDVFQKTGVELLNRAQVMQFTDFPADFQPTIQSIDTWFLSRKISVGNSRNKGCLGFTRMPVVCGGRILNQDVFQKTADFQPTIQSIDTWFLSRKIGMLFEAKVLNGKLIMIIQNRFMHLSGNNTFVSICSKVHGRHYQFTIEHRK